MMFIKIILKIFTIEILEFDSIQVKAFIEPKLVYYFMVIEGAIFTSLFFLLG